MDCCTGGPERAVVDAVVPPLDLLAPLAAVIGLAGNEADAGAIGRAFSFVVLGGLNLGLASDLVSTFCELSTWLAPPSPPAAWEGALVEVLMSLALGLVGSRVLVPSSGIKSAYKLSSGASSVGP